jgi:hypothetical protein
VDAGDFAAVTELTAQAVRAAASVSHRGPAAVAGN